MSYSSFFSPFYFTVPPKIDRTNLNKVRIKAGQSFNFDVNITGEPAPTVAWHFNGKKFLTSDALKIEDVPYNTKLTAKHARRSDTGKYTIIATNEHGKDEAEVEVIVLGNFLIVLIFLILKETVRCLL